MLIAKKQDDLHQLVEKCPPLKSPFQKLIWPVEDLREEIPELKSELWSDATELKEMHLHLMQLALIAMNQAPKEEMDQLLELCAESAARLSFWRELEPLIVKIPPKLSCLRSSSLFAPIRF